MPGMKLGRGWGLRVVLPWFRRMVARRKVHAWAGVPSGSPYGGYPPSMRQIGEAVGGAERPRERLTTRPAIESKRYPSW
jgi:hypothetical protein